MTDDPSQEETQREMINRGFRCIGPSDCLNRDDASILSNVLEKQFGCEIKVVQGKYWARRYLRKKSEYHRPELKPIHFLGELSISDASDKIAEILEPYLNSIGRMDAEIKKEEGICMERGRDRGEYFSEVGKEPNDSMYWHHIWKMVFLVDSADLIEVLTYHVFPSIRNRLGNDFISHIDVYCVDERRWKEGSIPAFFYFSRYNELKTLKKEESEGLSILHDWHYVDFLRLPALIIHIVSLLFYPYNRILTLERLGLVFVFYLKRPIKYRTRISPGNWLEFFASPAGFGKERTDPLRAVIDPESRDHLIIGHGRYVSESCLSESNTSELIQCLLERFTSLYSDASDPCNFHGGTYTIEPETSFAVMLSMDRIFRRTLDILTSNDELQRKLWAFEVTDILDELSKKFNGGLNFRTIFDTKEGRDYLLQKLEPLPIAIRDDMTKRAKEFYQELESTIIGSITLEKYKSEGFVNIPKVIKSHKTFKKRPVDKFVGDLARVIRNTHHGYFLDGTKTDKSPLTITTGNLPANLPDMVVLWVVAFLFEGWGMVGLEPLKYDHYD